MKKPYLVGICTLNEGEKIRRVIEKFADYDLYDVLLIDDGSTDGSLDFLKETPSLRVIRNDCPRGAGYGTRQILQYALANGYEAVFFVSGNDKDSPQDIRRLKEALDQGYDFVQGSRYHPGGRSGGMPAYRRVATRWVHPFVFFLVTGRWFSDTTNGFRAVRTNLMKDPRFDLDQSWLDQYELEPYFFAKAVRLGYRCCEVPVAKIYPPKAQGYTKMKPFSGWWSILRPLVYLGLGIRR